MSGSQIPPSIVKECIRVYLTELQKPRQGPMPEHRAAAFRSALEAFDALREVRVTVIRKSAPGTVKYLRAKFYDPIAVLTTGASVREVADKYEVKYPTATSWIHRAKAELGIRTTDELLAAIVTDRVRRRQDV